MPQFNLQDYETVESRIKRFYETFPDGRIITDWESSYQVDGASPNVWVIKAYIYLTDGDQATNLPKSTGYAFEIDGGPGANKTAALENAETSAIGRALANMGMSGNKRASREEMEKVSRVANKEDWLVEASKLKSVEDLRKLYIKAKANGATDDELSEIRRLADDRGSTGKPKRSVGGVSAGTTEGAV